MGLVGVVGVAVVTELTVDDLETCDFITFVRVGSGQFAEQFRTRYADTTSGGGHDFFLSGEIEVRRRENLRAAP